MLQYEKKWIEAWKRDRIFEVDRDSSKEKFFVNAPFPYMNGPLHIGHAFTYTRLDAFARYKRMKGYNVLFPFAWHWTGEAVAGQSVRLKKGDPAVIRAFVEIDGIPPNEIEKFTSPYNLAEYYTKVSKEALYELGLSIDWRREFYTTSYNKGFSKFIEWQYLKLRERKYVIRGSHPVVWCPFDQSPTGDHDRLEGEGVSPEEFYLVFFKMEDAFLAAATFRPETIYGATNVWILPNGEYAKVKVNDKNLIVSKETLTKFTEQEKKIEVIRFFYGKELVGKECIVPLSGHKVPILPATFIDPAYGTGVVYSVPAHAPYDWLALRDLLNSSNENLKKIIANIKPISIIKVDGFGEYPAIEIVEQLGVKDQNDKEAEKATEIVYSKEFHTGIMKENCGPFSGMPVKEAKVKVFEKLLLEGLGDKIYDLPQIVRCRCGTRCIVKILRDQWFLNYSNPDWKEKVREHVKTMKIFPEEARAWIFATIDWLNNWPCARKTGMGTPLPWDKEWIVETLSDSTIYMAYYIISKYVNSGVIDPEKMIPEFFDYVLLGEGKIEEVAKKSGIELNVLKNIREDFLYWYPVDLRNSAKELIPNHLTFFLFQHVAIFPKEMWPKGISVNGMITIEGKKMSKSKGIFTTISNEVKKYGADVVRAALIYGAEGMDDPDWNENIAKLMEQKILSLFDFINELMEKAECREKDFPEKLLLAELKKMILFEEKNLEQMKTKTAFQIAFFDIPNIVKRYLKQVTIPEKDTIKEVIEYWIKAMAPFIPFTCEELWHHIGKQTYISTEKWPTLTVDEEDYKVIFENRIIEKLLEDVKEIKKIAKVEPKTLYIYVAAPEVTKTFFRYLTYVESGLPTKEAIKKISEESTKNIMEYIPQLVKLANTLDKNLVDEARKIKDFNEFSIYKKNKEYLEKETNMIIKIFYSTEKEKYDPKNKAKNALPLKPALFLE
ncbi:MAG: leucine--tRNA ligase [Nitrososphaeria archaeon]